METIDELTAFLTDATVDGILGRLLYRGAAWSLMRENGVLPPNAPPLGATIETDLAEHGFALLRGAMALRAQAGTSDLTSKAFERSANAFEALVRNGDPNRLIEASAAPSLPQPIISPDFQPLPIRSSTRPRAISTPHPAKQRSNI